LKIKEIKEQMVSIPSGEISLRDDRKKTKWITQVQSFELSKFLITKELYCQVMSIPQPLPCEARKPVENVSWFDAVLFCNTLSILSGLESCYLVNIDSERVELISNAKGYRLPTDAEWEYACRAGSRAVQYGNIDDIAWFEGNSQDTTHSVGLKVPNSFGLFDMLGNVWEWCWDIYDPEVYGAYRVFRGGGWCDSSRGCLASNRRRSHPTYKVDDLGFRIARSC
tara:strand:- start:28 stop:699 length:672 start_codon:yes stop_codon:yes gene_type:complete